jgi:hypothetical protein
MQEQAADEWLEQTCADAARLAMKPRTENDLLRLERAKMGLDR